MKNKWIVSLLVAVIAIIITLIMPISDYKIADRVMIVSGIISFVFVLATGIRMIVQCAVKTSPYQHSNKSLRSFVTCLILFMFISFLALLLNSIFYAKIRKELRNDLARMGRHTVVLTIDDRVVDDSNKLIDNLMNLKGITNQGGWQSKMRKCQISDGNISLDLIVSPNAIHSDKSCVVFYPKYGVNVIGGFYYKEDDIVYFKKLIFDDTK